MNVPYEGVKVDGNHIARNLDYKGEHVICKFQKNRQGISPVASLEFEQNYQTFIHKNSISVTYVGNQRDALVFLREN